MVENDGAAATAQDSHLDVKGKGRADSRDHFGSPTSQLSVAAENISFNSVVNAELRSDEHGDIQEDENDAYFRRENADYARYWNGMDPRNLAPAGRMNSHSDNLLADWEKFEASTTGIKPVLSYQFQKNNPYLRGDRSQTRNHSIHSDERLEVRDHPFE